MPIDTGGWLFEDWLGQQDAPTYYVRPKTVEELVDFLASRDLAKLRVRGIGAGHSTSDVARPFRLPNDKAHAGVVVLTDRMALSSEAAAAAWWRDGVVEAERLSRVAGGVSIATLSRRFFADPRKLAFPNLGSYDQQEIAGALATGTHGTGMVTGPLSDIVASIELVTFFRNAAGKPELTRVRVEPKDGPTDRARFDAAHGVHQMVLVQENDAFYSAVVSLGFFGIVTAVTLRLVDHFWLDETQRLEEWGVLAPKLPAEARQDWFDFALSTRKTHQGPGGMEYKCLITTRERIASEGWGAARSDARRKHMLDKDKSGRHALTKHLANLASAHPRIACYEAVGVFEEEVQTKNRGGCNHMFRTSVGDLLLATSTEVSVPLADVVVAVEAILANNAKNDADHLHHTAPFGVRFSRGSKHYLSMAYGRDTCTIEAPILLYTDARRGPFRDEPSEVVIEEVLHRFEKAMRAAVPSARFHHGQRNHNTRADLEAYPAFAKWKAQYDRFNPFRVFSNGASKRWGLD